MEVNHMEVRQWHSFETRFMTLRDELRKFLKDNHIFYELSGCYSFYHFEINASQVEVDAINKFLDEHTIMEVR